MDTGSDLNTAPAAEAAAAAVARNLLTSATPMSISTRAAFAASDSTVVYVAGSVVVSVSTALSPFISTS